jgi:hypothetical protein
VSFLSVVTTGKQIGPQIHVITGNNGVGKTTWAASFPKTLIVDLEKGSDHLNVARIGSDKVTDLNSFRGLLGELCDSKHSYLTLAIDSVEALEGLISDAVCTEGNVKSIESFDGGYGKGYVRARELMREIFVQFRSLQSKGMTIILIAHTQVKSQSNPATNQTYDRVIMRCNDKMAALIRDMADNVFFATYKVFIEEDKNKKIKAYGDGQRIMYTQWRPGFDAKNRLELPLEIPLSYDAFIEKCNEGQNLDPETLIKEIKEMALGVDAELKSKVDHQIEMNKKDVLKLKEVKNRLMKYVS